MKAKPPAFQFYAKDFLVGTMEMSLIEIGAYTKLLAWSWDNGPVPSDERKRAIILGVTERSLRSLWDGIADKWAHTEVGYVNERLERQRTLLAGFTERQSQRGKAGADSRWHKHSHGMAQASAQASPDDGSPICNLQSPDPPRIDRSVGAARDGGLVNGTELRRHASQHAWCDWKRKMCVPHGLHDDLVGRLNRPNADETLRAWYPTVIDRYGDQPIGDSVFEFWRNEFAAKVGTVTQKPTSASGKGNQSRDAMQRALGRRVGSPEAL